jgi:hypothetical protein
MNSIILIGPKEWGDGHKYFLKQNGYACIGYSAEYMSFVRDKLDEMSKTENGFRLYIYVPETSTDGDSHEPIIGSGKIEFEGHVIKHWCFYYHAPSPKPYSKGFSRYRDSENEFWFELDSLLRYPHGIELEKFAIYSNNLNTPPRKYSRQEFTCRYRAKIALSHYPADEVIK